MVTIPVYNQAGEKVGDETIDPADFGGDDQQAAAS